MTIAEIQVQEFMNMLTGEDLPEGMRMNNQPKLNNESAFSIVWYLQEHLHLLPDNYEMCKVCKEIYDAHGGGHIISSDDSDWYKGMGISQAMIEQHEGVRLCSENCELAYWLDENESRSKSYKPGKV